MQNWRCTTNFGLIWVVLNLFYLENWIINKNLKNMISRPHSQRIAKTSVSVIFCEKFLQTDIFGEAFTMSISKGIQRLPSRIGVLLTLFVSLILIAYTGFKMQIMIEKRWIFSYFIKKNDFRALMPIAIFFKFLQKCITYL